MTHDDQSRAIHITDALGHDLVAMTDDYARQMLKWLDLEEAAGELTPGLAEFRELLRAQVEAMDE